MLKKTLGLLLNPMMMFLILMVIAWAIMSIRRYRPWGLRLMAVATLLILAFGFGPFVRTFMVPLEWQYSPPDKWLAANTEQASTIEYVVVLSAGATADSRLPAIAQLQDYSLTRVVEGIRQYRNLPGTKIIMSGGNYRSSISTAELMYQAAIELGVPAADLIIEDKSLDTKDQAVAIKAWVEDRLFVLVTSASHMPRSMRLMQGQGLSAIAAPADYVTKQDPDASWMPFIPSANAVRAAYRGLHEYVGMLWARLRGQFDPV